MVDVKKISQVSSLINCEGSDADIGNTERSVNLNKG